MPLSHKKDAARQRRNRAEKKAKRTTLLSKSLARKLHRLGVNPARYLTVASFPQGKDDYRALERQLAAKAQRIEWQSSGIRGLHEEVARLRALLATQPAMADTEVLKRLAAVEVEQALHEAEHGVVPIPESEIPPWKDFKRFVALHNQAEQEEARRGH